MSLISNDLRKHACSQHFLSFYEIRWQHPMIRSKVAFIKQKIVRMKEDMGMNEKISCFCGTIT